MTPFSGYEYLLIDAANNAGHDKELFEDRIQWAQTNLNNLEALAVDVKPKARPMYIKSVMAIREAQAGKPSGHLVGFDASASGIQIMSVLTGCIAGATATGLVDPNKRADAYTLTTEEMRKELGSNYTVARDDAKSALMKCMYGSRKAPKEIFGEDTPELSAFYKAATTVAPGAWDLLQVLLASWNSYALQHAWKLPDGYDAVVKVMVDKSDRIEVDELGHSTFTYEYSVNEGTNKGLSNAANLVHSVDAYVLRNIHRRCNYDREMVETVSDILWGELFMRQSELSIEDTPASSQMAYYIEQYNRSTVADPVIFSHITVDSVKLISHTHLQTLFGITASMLEYYPFEVVTIHDEFRCHANNMNHLRQQYINILAELAESDLLSDLLSQLYGTNYPVHKLSNNLGTLIRGSNYALC